jgi:hypothetical protein
MDKDRNTDRDSTADAGTGTKTGTKTWIRTWHSYGAIVSLAPYGLPMAPARVATALDTCSALWGCSPDDVLAELEIVGN